MEAIRKLSQPVTGDAIAQVGTISANNDSTIGNIIAEAMKKVGKDGVITVEEAKTMETQLDVVEGMQFDRGYLSPYFVTDPERMEVVMEDPFILIHEKKISVMKDLLPLLEQIARAGKPLLIVCEDVGRRGAGHPGGQQAAGDAGLRRSQGAGLRRPAQGHAGGHRHVLTGGKAIMEETGIKLESIRLEDLGKRQGGSPLTRTTPPSSRVPAPRRRSKAG